MEKFVSLVSLRCGDLRELQSCSDTCISALKTLSSEKGCCYETILQGYEHVAPETAAAWRHWQGQASGKCGVAFSSKTCGHSVGEKPFRDLEHSVDNVQEQATRNYDNFGNLIDKLLAPQYADPYDSYDDEPYAEEPVRPPLTPPPLRVESGGMSSRREVSLQAPADRGGACPDTHTTQAHEEQYANEPADQQYASEPQEEYADEPQV